MRKVLENLAMQKSAKLLKLNIRKEKDIVYEQLLEQQKQDSIELSYNPYLLSDYAFRKANSSIYSYNSIKNQFVMIRGINAGFDAPKRISMNVY